ncbi:MAG: antitoxin [Antricoccus sp.]
MSLLNDAKKKLDELKNGKAGELVAGNLDKVTAAANKATKGKYRGQIDSVGHKVEQYLESDRPSENPTGTTPKPDAGTGTTDTATPRTTTPETTTPETTTPETTISDKPDDGPTRSTPM